MGKENYYKTLEVDRTASEQDLKRAYKKLALRWHPEKNPTNSEEAEAKFKAISHAYDVLRDPLQRAAYDRRGGTPPPDAGGYSGTSDGGGAPSPPKPRSGDDVFYEVFRSSSSFKSMDSWLLSKSVVAAYVVRVIYVAWNIYYGLLVLGFWASFS